MLVAAAGAALVAMVARICAKNDAYAADQAFFADVARRADARRSELLCARLRDEAAFARVMDAMALPRGDATERQRRKTVLAQELLDAAQAPLEGSAIALEVLRLAVRLLERPNANVISDAGCAGEFAASSIAACAYNVRINHRFLQRDERTDVQAETIARYERESIALLAVLRRGVAATIAG